MSKRFLSFGLLLPLAACVAGPSETVGAASSDVTLTGADSCICNEPTPPGNHPKQGGCSCPSWVKLSIAPGQTGLPFQVQAGLDWPNPAAISFSLSGLPTGVTSTWVQTQGYLAPNQDIEGYFSLSATTSAPATSTPAIVSVTLASEGSTNVGAFKLTVGGVCVPSTQCDPNQCGAIPNGCSGTIECAGCGLNATCIANVCEPKAACPAGTHNCGGGVCAKVCE